MKNLCFTIAFSLLAIFAFAQSPVKQVHAYSRATLPGTPGGQQFTPPLTYYIYIAVAKGSKISVSYVYISGKYYPASVEKVQTPVYLKDEVANMEHKQVLVNSTANDVYQIHIGEAINKPSLTAAENKLVSDNQLVVFLTCGGPAHATAKSINILPPSAGM